MAVAKKAAAKKPKAKEVVVAKKRRGRPPKVAAAPTPATVKPAAKRASKRAAPAAPAAKRPAAKRGRPAGSKTAKVHAIKTGRKPLSTNEITQGRSLRMPESYWAKVDKLGGAQCIRDAVKAMPGPRVKAA